jgi:hypothetical protein
LLNIKYSRYEVAGWRLSRVLNNRNTCLGLDDASTLLYNFSE